MNKLYCQYCSGAMGRIPQPSGEYKKICLDDECRKEQSRRIERNYSGPSFEVCIGESEKN